jgi:FecR protein
MSLLIQLLGNSMTEHKRHRGRAMLKVLGWTAALVSVVLFALQPAGSLAATRIGVAASIKPNAERLAGTSSETLAAGSELYANETVRTGNLGQADLVFVDKTNLTVGPASEVRLDKFVYDPNGRSGQVVLQMSKGAFRFVTGSQDHRAYQVTTPYGTLGVRGTVVEMIVQPKRTRRERADKCDVKVRLVEGRATYRTSSGRIAELTEPNQVICVSELGNVSRSTSTESILTFEVGDVGGGGPPPPVVVPPPGGTPGGVPCCRIDQCGSSTLPRCPQ